MIDNSAEQSMQTEPALDIPVLIVGGGPSGLLQAYILSRLGGECGHNSVMYGVDQDSQMHHY